MPILYYIHYRSIDDTPLYASCISVTTHLQIGRLTRDTLIIDRNHDYHAPLMEKRTSLQVDSRYSNISVTLIEQYS